MQKQKKRAATIDSRERFILLPNRKISDNNTGKLKTLLTAQIFVCENFGNLNSVTVFQETIECFIIPSDLSENTGILHFYLTNVKFFVIHSGYYYYVSLSFEKHRRPS